MRVSLLKNDLFDECKHLFAVSFSFPTHLFQSHHKQALPITFLELIIPRFLCQAHPFYFSTDTPENH